MLNGYNIRFIVVNDGSKRDLRKKFCTSFDK